MAERAPAGSRRLGPLARRRLRRRAEREYWDFFVNTPPADPLNSLPEHIRAAPEGSVNSVRGDVHTPAIMTEHVKEIAKKFGSDLVGVIDLAAAGLASASPGEARFAVVCAVPAEHDPAAARGVGGQVPVQNGLLVSFLLSAFFRESGYFAKMVDAAPQERIALAVRAGLGGLRGGRLTTAQYGTKVWVADIVYTDFPLLAT